MAGTENSRELFREFPLDKKKIWKKFLEKIPLVGFVAFWLFGAATIGGFAMGGAFAFLGLFGLALGVGLVGFLFYWSSEYYNKYYYAIEGNALKVKKGVFFPNSGSIPLEKISDIYSDQDILDRIFGIYDLHFSSASETSGNLSHIDGLSQGAMENLRELLKAGISAKKGGISKASGTSGTERPEFSFKPGGFPAYARQLLGVSMQWAIGIGFFFLQFVIVFPAVALGLFAIVLVVAGFFTKLEVDSISYEILPDGIKTRQGWLTPKESFLFYGNIQDVEVSESFLDRLFSLATVSVKSMSYESALSTRLALLSKEDSEKIVSLVREKTRAYSGKTQKASKEKAEEAQISGKPRIFAHRFFFDSFLGVAYFSAVLFILAGLASIGIASFSSAPIDEKLLLIALAFGIWLGLSIIVLIFGLIGAAIENVAVFYYLSSEGIVVGRDFISRHTKTIKYEKIQDIRINCGTLQSFFGLVSISFETGSKEVQSTDNGEAAVAGESALERLNSISLSDALKLRHEILQRMGVSYPYRNSPSETLRAKADLAGTKPLKKTVSSSFVLFVLVKGLLLLTLLSGILSGNWKAFFPAIGIGILAFLAVVLRYLYEKRYYEKYHYDENEQVLVVRKGAFGWSEIVMPYRNIQTVYVDQDIFDVFFGLYDVWVTTVTGASSNLSHIDGVEGVRAEWLSRLFSYRVERARK